MRFTFFWGGGNEKFIDKIRGLRKKKYDFVGGREEA